MPRIPFTATTYKLFFQVLLWDKTIQSWLSYHYTQAKHLGFLIDCQQAVF